MLYPTQEQKEAEDQRDYGHDWESQIWLLNNSREEQRLQTKRTQPSLKQRQERRQMNQTKREYLRRDRETSEEKRDTAAVGTSLFLCVVCMCVCVKEREREGEWSE